MIDGNSTGTPCFTELLCKPGNVLAIIGSRTFENLGWGLLHIKAYLESTNSTIVKFVSGGAVGADKLAEYAAKQLEIPIEIVRPDWKLGRHAGMLRNNSIIGRCDEALVFWDYSSRGTKDSISKLAKAKKPFTIVSTITGEIECFNYRGW